MPHFGVVFLRIGLLNNENLLHLCDWYINRFWIFIRLITDFISKCNCHHYLSLDMNSTFSCIGCGSCFSNARNLEHHRPLCLLQVGSDIFCFFVLNLFVSLASVYHYRTYKSSNTLVLCQKRQDKFCFRVLRFSDCLSHIYYYCNIW